MAGEEYTQPLHVNFHFSAPVAPSTAYTFLSELPKYTVPSEPTAGLLCTMLPVVKFHCGTMNHAEVSKRTGIFIAASSIRCTLHQHG